MRIGEYPLTPPFRGRPGRRIAAVPGGELHLALPPSRLALADSAFGGAAAELFGPGVPACGVRFEARVLAHLAGVPGVPTLLGSGTHEGAAWFAQAPPAGAAPADPMDFVRHHLDLLAALHERGVVHRALCPAVLVGGGLVDFEAALLGEQGIAGRVGLPTPEQVARSLGAPVVPDHRVDLFGLGSVLAVRWPDPPPAVGRLIEALLQPLTRRPPTVEAARALLEGATWPAAPPPTRFAEALRAGDPVAALALARATGERRRVAHVAAALAEAAAEWLGMQAEDPDSPADFARPTPFGVATELWAEARAAVEQARARSPDLGLVAAELAPTADAAEAELWATLEAAPGVAGAVAEVALGRGLYGVAVAAAIRAVAAEGPDRLRWVTGRLVAAEARVQAAEPVAEALVAACVAQGLLGEGSEPPAVVQRSYARAIEAGARLVRGWPSAEVATLLAFAGQQRRDRFAAPLEHYARRVASAEGDEPPEDLRAAARAVLGLG